MGLVMLWPQHMSGCSSAACCLVWVCYHQETNINSPPFLCLCLAAEGWDVCCRGIHASSALQDDHPLHCVWHHAGRHSHPQRYILCVRVCMNTGVQIE